MTLKKLLETDAHLRAAMQEKSAAILEADTLKSQGDLPAAMQHYKRAAELEYRIFRYLEDARLTRAALISLISAASCWYEAEELLAARKALHEALERSSGNESVSEDCAELLAKIEAALSSSRTADGTARVPEQVKA